MSMETQNKQWVCHPVLDNTGQLGPEDLSSTSKALHNRLNIGDKPHSTSMKDQQIELDVQNKNGLDQFFVRQIEDSICENSRQTIVRILDDVTKLTSIEKLLLYLKLPTDINNISDPLRQPLNPLGSRTEISQTIMWIRTHLEEDPELSLPKQEVYNEYTIHCANNKMKPLSTADFGKVMKQVYPSVRPRRLGTRGNSRYCYAGLRKRFKLEVPQLPDLADRPQSSESLCTQSELTAAACTIVCEWAESILGTRFQSVYVLASYLVRHAPQNVSINSGAAALLGDYAEGVHSKEELLPYSNHVNLKHKEAQLQLQRKLQQREFKRKLQLQSPKAEPKPKCKKSKLLQGPPIRSVSLDSMESESPKPQGYQMTSVCDKSNECTLPDFSSFQLKKPVPEEVEKPPLLGKKDTEPNSRTHTSLDDEIYDPTLPDETLKLRDTLKLKPDALKPDAFKPEPSGIETSKPDAVKIDPVKVETLRPNFVGKLPIPRLPNHQRMKNAHPVRSVILGPTRKGQGHGQSQKNLKYKAIQPKPPGKCDEIPEGNETIDTDIQITTDDTLKNADYLTRERLISVSNVDKDALDDYLHGGGNSQEQEEELMQYFKNDSANGEDYAGDGTNAKGQVQTTQIEQDELSNGSKSDKISQLRLLLEQNLQSSATGLTEGLHPHPHPHPGNKDVSASNPVGGGPFAKHTQFSSSNSSLAQNFVLHSPHLPTGIKRRVSFETSVMDSETVPPSPNTRRKNFSFTPISPGPHSPGGRQSKCSSTNASPFVSPRNTPVPRAKMSHNHSQPQGGSSFIIQPQTGRKHPALPALIKPVLKHEAPDLYNHNPESEKIFGDIIEEKHFVNPTDIMPKCLPMSAPPSPMLPYRHKITNSNLLQKLLDSSSKVSYMPDYGKTVHGTSATSAPPSANAGTYDSLSQEVSQLLNSTATPAPAPAESAYRSQSVPLHQMASIKTLMSPCVPTTQPQHTHFNFNFAPDSRPAEFSEFEPFDLNPELNPDLNSDLNPGLATELNSGLNNENLSQIFNILETETTQSGQIEEQVQQQQPLSASRTEVPTGNVFTFETNLIQNELISVHKLIRSQSIDLNPGMRECTGCEAAKYPQPSRSVPGTPSPYPKAKTQLPLSINNNQTDLHPEMFCQPPPNQDFLINGQPVKGKFSLNLPVAGAVEISREMSEGRSFPPSLGFTISDNKQPPFRNSAENYDGARRNLNPVLEQQFSETDDFSTAVPGINTGTS